CRSRRRAGTTGPRPPRGRPGGDRRRRARPSLAAPMEITGPMDITGREFEDLAGHAPQAYLRYSFTRGTDPEGALLAEVLDLQPGMRVLDVGCGPGRHAHALAERGMEVVGIDIAAAFLAAAGPGRWVRGDARRLPFFPGSFDAAISLCQGGFGLLGGP